MALLFAGTPLRAQTSTLAGHEVRLGGEGKIISWYDPPERAFHFVATAPWAYLAAMPIQANGLPTYYAYPTFDPATGGPVPINPFHNPAGLYGMLADGAAAQFAYSGDLGVVQLVKGVLDHQLASGSTPAEWLWPNVPYASSEPGAVVYQGGDDTKPTGNGPGGGDGFFVIEPDKVGELGLGYLKFWQLTGESRYLNGALSCADALAAHVRQGDATHSPWPFRVRARTGEVVEEYTAHAVGPVKLLDALVRAGIGHVGAYRAARDAAWAWVLAFPLQTELWSAYFEDVPVIDDLASNLNQYAAMETARFMLLRPELDPDWRAHVPRIIAWVERTFGRDHGPQPGIQYGAQTISEQSVTMDKMGSHTARYASVLALWSERTGDAAARDKALRSLSWATYMCDANGVVDVGDHLGNWFTDGYGDYTRHFLAAIGAVPEWAPPGEAHLLRSTSVVREIAYEPERVAYRTFDAAASEVLRLPREPTAVDVGGRRLARRAALGPDSFTVSAVEGGDFIVRLQRTGAPDVVVWLGPAPPPARGGCAAAGGAGIFGGLLLAAALAARLQRRGGRPPLASARPLASAHEGARNPSTKPTRSQS